MAVLYNYFDLGARSTLNGLKVTVKILREIRTMRVVAQTRRIYAYESVWTRMYKVHVFVLHIE